MTSKTCSACGRQRYVTYVAEHGESLCHGCEMWAIDILPLERRYGPPLWEATINLEDIYGPRQIVCNRTQWETYWRSVSRRPAPIIRALAETAEACHG